MNKNWLIRTNQKKILGPVTKEKILEFIEKGSLNSEDEICCGNGYWFYVKEKKLIFKYLTSGEIQGFNPITEAKVNFDALANNREEVEESKNLGNQEQADADYAEAIRLDPGLADGEDS